MNPSEYRWSSHRAYCGLEIQLWFSNEPMLATFGAKMGQARNRFEKFVMDGIAEVFSPEAARLLATVCTTWGNPSSPAMKGPSVEAIGEIDSGLMVLPRGWPQAHPRGCIERLTQSKSSIPVMILNRRHHRWKHEAREDNA